MRTAFLLILCLGVPALTGASLPAAVAQEATCPECKAKLKADAKFCTGCGAKITPKLCAECKAPLKLDAKFCPGCGKKVEEAPAPKPEPKPEPKAEPKPDPKPEPGKKPPEPQE
ncbi:MAG: zinc ribbon domain-containing protein, partial [Planctomycetes bacterium]|nr:zinc ribbon domain-containing protein [Planctomycetota bacterium]